VLAAALVQPIRHGIKGLQHLVPILGGDAMGAVVDEIRSCLE